MPKAIDWNEKLQTKSYIYFSHMLAYLADFGLSLYLQQGTAKALVSLHICADSPGP